MWTIYKHTRGLLYLKLGVALHSETCEPLVVYRTLYDNEMAPVWARPQEMFYEEVTPGQNRFTEVARVRVLMPEDATTFLAFGHDAWGEGRSVSDFIASYSHDKNHLRGTRFLIESPHNEPIGNLNTIRFARRVVGIASISINPIHRGNGYASMLTRAVMELIRSSDPSTRFMLYSEVSPTIYERLGFQRAPEHAQFHLPAIAMHTGDTPLNEHEVSFLREYF
jgi:RimJ/RimL family protein N-acetyltransferase